MCRLVPLLAVRTALLCLLGLTGLVAGCSVPASRSGSTPSTVVAPNATVIDVADGDTIVVRVAGQRETVRLIGIDTPETKDPDEPVQCFGPEATEATEALLPRGTPVRLERDAEPRDQYGRLLAYVYRSDGLFVNLALAEQGFADVLSIAPNTAHAGDVRAAVDAARAGGRGLWGGCAGFGVPA
jgi:micrococcal nuclease